MRFGGHETFTVREGWLSKGIRLVASDSAKLADEFASDYLGVGRNMAKSIRHWLVATGLAIPMKAGGRKILGYELTELGKVVHDNDPYFVHEGTWWALHTKLVNTPEHALTWHWFFNHFNMARFEKAVAVENLRNFMHFRNERPTTPRTLERDVGCMLASYAKSIPKERKDPEDTSDSPFTELGLLRYYKESGAYALDRDFRPIAPELLCFALTAWLTKEEIRESPLSVPLLDAAREPFSPGRVFALTNEALFELAQQADGVLPDEQFRIVGLAGERRIQLTALPVAVWLEDYYKRLASEECNVA
jgi:hypothetical protein